MNEWQKEKYRHLGLNIVHYRRLRGYTQEKLAELVGVERITIARLETATVGASLDTVFEIADALNVEPAKLFEIRE